MKTKELRGMSEKELLNLKRDLEFSRMKASSVWGEGKVKDKEAGINTKGTAMKGDKTSLQKQIRRNIAQVNTILREREINLHKTKWKNKQ